MRDGNGLSLQAPSHSLKRFQRMSNPEPSPYNAVLCGREEINAQLQIVRVASDAPLFEFKPGQFAVLGLLGREPRVGEAGERIRLPIRPR